MREKIDNLDKRNMENGPNNIEKEDVIIGIHSILEALKNPIRQEPMLFATDKGHKELKSKISADLYKKLKVNILGLHDFKLKVERIFNERNLKVPKIPSGILLLVSPLQVYDVNWLINYTNKNQSLKIFCLDQVTDVHNGAAILRTAAFYGVDILLLNSKGSFGLTPSFYRIASGATEHVNIVLCHNLPKTIKRLEEAGVECIGFAEESDVISAKKDISPVTHMNENEPNNKKSHSRCLIFGAEDKGLSYAVRRVLSKIVSFKSRGKIQTLNVSVAAGIGMERYF